MRATRRLLRTVAAAAQADPEAAQPPPAAAAFAVAPTARQLSVDEWLAAVVALRRGDFAHYGLALPAHRPAELSDRVPHPRMSLEEGTQERLAASTVLVLAAHPGAGASTVAAAVAEGMASRGHRVRLVDCADPARSGLAAAATAELGVHAAGWRRGRRDSVAVDRLAWPATATESLPRPLSAADGPPEVLVVDVGWPARQVLAASGWVGGLVQDAAVLLVCRASVPGVHHAEHLLAELDRPAVVAVVGAARLPGPVTATLGPALRAARDTGRLIGVPADRRLQVAGLSADPLPKSVAAAGRRLAAVLYPDQPELAGLSLTSPTKDAS